MALMSNIFVGSSRRRRSGLHRGKKLKNQNILLGGGGSEIHEDKVTIRCTF